MSYGYRRKTARKNRKKNRAIIRNRSAKSQAYQIVSLNKRVMRLKNSLSDKGNYFTYYNEGRQSLPAITGTSIAGYGYSIFRMHPRPTTWEACLNRPTSAQLTSDKWRLRKTFSQIRISVGNELAPISYSVFIIKVRPSMRQMAYENWGTDLENFYNPALPGTSTPDAIAFNPINTFDSGFTCLNEHAFKVVKAYHFDLGQYAYGSQTPGIRNMANTVKNIRFTQHYGGKRGLLLERSAGEVEDGLATSNRTVNQRAWTFCLIVTNNASNDLQSPVVEYTNLHTLSTDD